MYKHIINIAAACLLAACSGDDAEARDASTDARSDTGPALVGACTNASDLPKTDARYAYDGQQLLLGELTAACTRECMLQIDRAPCTRACVRQHTANAISTPCTECFVAVSECVVGQCLSQCSADMYSQRCTDCACGKNGGNNCADAFTACAGIVTTRCN